MFLFYDSRQNDSNASYYKGLLFEKLLNDYLSSTGYTVKMRQKRNSLEYDLEGINRATRVQVIGEAKALGNSIRGETLSAFVGKLMPLGIIERKIHGLFLATSSLTPDANDYFRQVERFGITCLTGAALEDAIQRELGLPQRETIWKLFESSPYTPQTIHLLATDNGIFLVAISASPDSVAPSFFTLFDSAAREIPDENFLAACKSHIDTLAPLEPVTLNKSKKNIIKIDDTRIIPLGLTLGKDWTDYRLPAPPAFYVGRKELIKEIISAIISSSAPRLIQVKSRSGVGKSSTLASIEAHLKELGLSTELHDARDVKSIIDVFAVVRRFTGANENPIDFMEVESQLTTFSENLGNKTAVFMIDQFEATFTKPEVFNAYETLALIFQRIPNRIVFCVARKNDQLTTYDDTKISLERINSFSESFELKDFTKFEAKELLEHINNNAHRRMNRSVLSYVLEFAQGFPWLLKRTMAHILRLTETVQTDQPELIASSLRLNDLFDEELEGLEENEKDYLVRISARLPADYRQLHVLFDEDPLLPQVLDKLTRTRLLRLTGSTYDTYNDVFKEYLVYNKLPEFRQSTLYRIYPGSVVGTFQKAVGAQPFDIDKLANYLDMSRGSIFNHLREWRHLNLVRLDNGLWTIPQSVLDVISQGTLGEYLRRQVSSNDIISRILTRVESNSYVRIDSLPEFLKESFPFVEATEQTWKLYANVIKSWLRVLKLADIQEGKLIPISADRKEVVRTLGNLVTITRGRRGGYAAFVPTASWHFIESAVEQLLNGNIPSGGELGKAFQDLKNGGWYVENEFQFASLSSFKEDVSEMLNNEPYTELWIAANQNEPLLKTFRKILGTNQADQTLRWRLKKLLNWAKNLDIIPNRRYRY
ncbi:restriction endonuclease [Rhodohalobacter sp.]|uniref:nSTAND1 domain-containing NTPase n=1 Tax=Rhodohalobacter sp. TaxID=1974210 RepID=UPI003564623F